MQNLNQMLQVVRAASVISDLTRQKHTHTLPARAQTTVYLHADDAVLRVVRWDRSQVEATIETRPPLGWRVATDYDDNGVYVVMVKRPGFGAMAKATLSVLIPQDAYLVMRMNNGLVTLDHVYGTLSIAPPENDTSTTDGYLTDGISE